jgi:hypothetical protein
MADFGKRLVSFWENQRKYWRIVVTSTIFKRFLMRFTVDYNINVRTLGATPLQRGLLNSVTNATSTVI